MNARSNTNDTQLYVCIELYDTAYVLYSASITSPIHMNEFDHEIARHTVFLLIITFILKIL